MTQSTAQWRKRLGEAYPRALTFSRLLEHSVRVLGKEGFTPEGTLLGNSICRDELNKASLQTFAAHWGENFELSGLGGMPSAGRTGFGAYVAHVPEGGALFVLFGAHIGVSKSGEIGKTERPGLAGPSSACGALVAFGQRLMNDASYSPAFDMNDVEQFVLERSILDADPGLARTSPDIVALTDAAHAEIHRRVLDLASGYRSRLPIALLGGVMINTPLGEEDHFDPRFARTWRPGGEEQDWLDELKA